MSAATPAVPPPAAPSAARVRFAVTYAGFLDAIEPSEWPYHRDDVLACLSAAVSASIVKG